MQTTPCPNIREITPRQKHYDVTVLSLWRETHVVTAASPEEARRLAEQHETEELYGEGVALLVETVTEVSEDKARRMRGHVAAMLAGELAE